MRGRYVFADDAPCWPGLTYFASRNWHAGDGTLWPEFGEVEGVRQRWRDGSRPGPAPELVQVGTAAQIDGTASMPTDAGPHVYGLPLECWSKSPSLYCGEGGDGDDCSAIVVYGPVVTSEGGDGDGGEAGVDAEVVYTSEGGDGDGGEAGVDAEVVYTSEGGDGDGGEAGVEPPPAGVTFAGCSDVSETLSISLNTIPPNGLDATGTTLTWDGSQFNGTLSACGGTTFTITLTESGSTAVLTITAAPFAFGPDNHDTKSCGPPFACSFSGFAFFPSCGPPATLIAAVIAV